MDNVFEIINTETINSNEEARDFINKLTNHSTPLREAVSIKLVDIIKKYPNYFEDDFSIQKILDAIVDINPNVSRSICTLIDENPKYKSLLEDKIITRIEEILSKILSDNKKEHLLNTKSHAKNKKIFALYWLLEALSICQSPLYRQKILNILNITIDFKDYTIREKTAKILAKMDNAPMQLLQKANLDQNFYVKMQVYDKMRKSI